MGRGNSDKVIADLSRENFELKEQVAAMKEAVDGIHGVLFCIGGPLNDNVKKFNPEQLKTFWRINDYLRGAK